MGCATSFVRGLFFAFNFVFWVLGLVVLGIGIYSRIETDTWRGDFLHLFYFSKQLGLRPSKSEATFEAQVSPVA